MLRTRQPLDRATEEITQRHHVLLGLNVEAFNLPVELEDMAWEDVSPQIPLKKAKSATLALDLGVETKVELEIAFPDEAAAGEGASVVRTALSVLDRFLVKPLLANLQGDPGWEHEVKLLKRFWSAMEQSEVEQHNAFVRVNASFKSDQEELDRA